MDGRDGRPKFSLDFRQALRAAVEGSELLKEEEDVELPRAIRSRLQAVSNTGDARLQLSGWRTYARRHSAPSVIASVASAEALVSDLEDKEIVAQEAVDDLAQTLLIYRAQQWEREVNFLESFADPLLVEVGLLKPMPAPESVGATALINNPELERERVIAESDLSQRRQRLEDVRTCYTNNLDRALMSRLRTTKKGFDESYFQQISRATRQVIEAEEQCADVMRRAREGGFVHFEQQESDFDDHSEDGKADSESSDFQHLRAVQRGEAAPAILRWRLNVGGNKDAVPQALDPSEGLPPELSSVSFAEDYADFEVEARTRINIDRHRRQMELTRESSARARIDLLGEQVDGA